MSTFTDLIDLAAERLGGAVLYANDEFFAEKENLLKAKAPVFLEHEYTDRGKWMDGWESRRRRTAGHDFCLVRLGQAGIVRGVVVDTAFFRGNYPEQCSIEATVARADASPDQLLQPSTRWVELLPQTLLRGNSTNAFEVQSGHRVTHLRFNIFPDGGVARLRVHGTVVPDWQRLGRAGAEFDVAAAENGGEALSCSDMFFGVRHNLIMPGRAVNMGEGWETKRRRGLFGPGATPQHDWALVALAAEATLRRIEVDTHHFKGNYPDSAMIEGCRVDDAAAITEAQWQEILPPTKLQAHTKHLFEDELAHRGPFSHVRLNIYPDGGVSRLRIFGVVTPGGLASRRLHRLDTLFAEDAAAELLACCGSTAWANEMARLRPFRTVEALLAAADRVWAGLAERDWLEAFRAHPRIGESKPGTTQPARATAFARGEQSGAAGASAETMEALAIGNGDYDAKFGHLFIVCATGKTAEEMLALLRTRLSNSPSAELATAAEEQRKITRIRLEKLLTS